VGPPGVARPPGAPDASSFNAEFIALSAAFSGVKDIREACSMPKPYCAVGAATILFVDECTASTRAAGRIPAFVEQGLFTFIGATTKTPRSNEQRVVVARRRVCASRAWTKTNSGSCLNVPGRPACRPAVRRERARTPDRACRRDARRLLNLLEIIQTAAGAATHSIDGAFVDNALSRNLRRFDKGGDAFYDQIRH